MITEMIGRELKGLRAKNNYNLQEVADNVGVHRETLRKYEKNTNKMPIYLLVKLLKFYKVEPHIFFTNINA